MLLTFILGVGQVHPGEKTVEEETEWILVHIEDTTLWLLKNLLVVLDVVEVDALYSITEVVLVYVGVSG